jgi:hypothetical protein
MNIREEVSLRFTRVEYGLLGLALVTGLIHVYVGVVNQFNLLILAGAGYLGGMALFSLRRFRKYVVALSIPYTLAQFVGYYQFFGFNVSAEAAVDKVVQAVFVVLGFYYFRKDR